jgi:hypothetical protein
MIPDESDTNDTESRPSPRLSVRFDGKAGWSAFRGAILLASGLPTVTEAWDVINRANDRAASPPSSDPQSEGPRNETPRNSRPVRLRRR